MDVLQQKERETRIAKILTENASKNLKTFSKLTLNRFSVKKNITLKKLEKRIIRTKKNPCVELSTIFQSIYITEDVHSQHHLAKMGEP